MYTENNYNEEEKLNPNLPHPIVSDINYFLNYDGTGLSFDKDLESKNLYNYLKKIFIERYSHLSKEQFEKLHELIIKDLKIEQSRSEEIEEYNKIIKFFIDKVRYEGICKLQLDKHLLALACGDSYGSYYEYEGLLGHTFDIKKLPNKPVEKHITDDTKMAMILLKHYKYNKMLIKSELLKDYKTWANTDGRDDGIGIHTYNVLVKGKTDKDSQGNGTLMRVVPLAINLLKDEHEKSKIHELMNQDAFLSHENETISIMNGFLLDLLIDGIEVLENPAYKEFTSKFVLGNAAWLMHSLYIVVETLKKNIGFVKGFKYITSFGGDTDTNCAIYAAIKSYTKDIRDEVDIKDFLRDEDIEELKTY